MKDKRRTQADRTAATRQALIAAGRSLFAVEGFGDVGAEKIARLAGVTRGALYHHFADKTELFAAVFEAVEADIIARIGATIATAPQEDPIALMHLGARLWLDACSEPEIHRIALLDAPAVLGWMRWREIGSRYGMAIVQALLTQAIAMGRVREQPVPPLAYVLLGALRESALYVAGADDHAQARAQIGAVFEGLITSLDTGAKPR